MTTPRKKRILFCNDAHFLLTGYGKYGRNLLNRLADTGKYELAELACFASIGDERDAGCRWRYYPNGVGDKDSRYNAYISNPGNEFGKWRFERVLLDFKPDIVMSIADPWMIAYQKTSPLRQYYHWCIMPTVDSAPQQEEFIELFIDADSVFTYSDWGLDVLKKGAGDINLIRSAPPGVDLDIYKPTEDKGAHRKNMGFDPEANIIGTIMRNQVRKLYPDLFHSFRKFLDMCYETDEPDLANKSYLYVHTSYPDMGWDIPLLLKTYGLGHKVIFTYICSNCNHPSAMFFQDARTVCPFCNHTSATLPNVGTGLEPHQLAQVLNMFDVYIQYAVCEGFGMPQVEATACGVPIMSVDYSAMSDVLRKTCGIPLEVERMFHDIGTGSSRALPDNDKCAKQIYKFFNTPHAMRRRHGRSARKATEVFYNWDITAKIWETHFDEIELCDKQGKWGAPMVQHNIPDFIPTPEQLSNSQFVDWLVTEVMLEPRLLHSRVAMTWLKDMNYGAKMSGKDLVPVNRETLYNDCLILAENKINCEMARTGAVMLEPVDYINYSHSKAELLV